MQAVTVFIDAATACADKNTKGAPEIRGPFFPDTAGMRYRITVILRVTLFTAVCIFTK
jgi:hypothetical protein